MNLPTPQSELIQKPLLYMNVNSYPETSQLNIKKLPDSEFFSVISGVVDTGD
jgi:hypothetical protein